MLRTLKNSVRKALIKNGRNFCPYSPSCSVQYSQCLTYCISINVPFIAESISKGRIREWNKSVGDSVVEDEEICDIESDKLTISVKAPTNGKILAIQLKKAI